MGGEGIGVGAAGNGPFDVDQPKPGAAAKESLWVSSHQEMSNTGYTPITPGESRFAAQHGSAPTWSVQDRQPLILAVTLATIDFCS